MTAAFRYDQAYARDLLRRRALLELATRVFGNDDIARFASLGFWEESFTPFSYFDGDQCVANVAVVDLPLLACGARLRAGGVQAVATHPDYRRRGLFHGLARRALEFAGQRHETLLLFTAAPALYEPLGFRVVPDDVFAAAVEPAPRRHETRPLSIERDADVSLVRASLARRAPLSSVLSALGGEALFLFNEVRHDLRRVLHAPALDALLVWERRERTLRLLDVIAARVPPLEDLLARFDPPIERIEFGFTPERFELRCDVAPRRDGDYLLARGPFPPEGSPFAFPATWYF